MKNLIKSSIYISLTLFMLFSCEQSDTDSLLTGSEFNSENLDPFASARVGDFTAFENNDCEILQEFVLSDWIGNNVGVGVVCNNDDELCFNFLLNDEYDDFHVIAASYLFVGTSEDWNAMNFLNEPPLPNEISASSTEDEGVYNVFNFETYDNPDIMLSRCIPLEDWMIEDCFIWSAKVVLDDTRTSGPDFKNAFALPLLGGYTWDPENEICFTYGGCETAFAKGGYVFVTDDDKSNPEGLPSLDLIKNRWGWAIKLMETGETTYDIWAAAGLNDIDKGILVGTLTLNWDGENISFNYDMENGYCMSELHFYAGDMEPDTVAPGKYGYTQEFDPNQDSYSSSLPLVDVDEDGVWIIAHAEVCGDCR